MTRIVRRLAETLAVLVVLAIAVFAIGRLVPGDPLAQLATQPGLGATELAQLRVALALDTSVWTQASAWVTGLAAGDLGVSLISGQPVGPEIMRRLPASVELALMGMMVALLLALPLALVAARSPGGLADHIARALAAFWGAVPTFLSGLILIEVVYARTGVAPEPIGRYPLFGPDPPALRTGLMLVDAVIAGDLAALRAAAAQGLLPAICMGLFAFGPILRLARAALLAAGASAHVEAARALGLGSGHIRLHHVWRACAAPVIAVVAMTLCYLLGAAAVVERVFAWPGIGRYALEAALARDQAPVLGAVLAVGGLVVVVQLGAEALQALIDPRVRDGI